MKNVVVYSFDGPGVFRWIRHKDAIIEAIVTECIESGKDPTCYHYLSGEVLAVKVSEGMSIGKMLDHLADWAEDEYGYDLNEQISNLSEAALNDLSSKVESWIDRHLKIVGRSKITNIQRCMVTHDDVERVGLYTM